MKRKSLRNKVDPKKLAITNSRIKKKKSITSELSNASIGLIGLRKIIQTVTGLYQAVLEHLKNLPNLLPPQAVAMLKAIVPLQMLIYALYTTISSISASIRIYDIWNSKGRYEDKPASKFKKVKTTIFTGGMALSDISVFIFTILVLSGVSTFLSVPAMVLLTINGAVNLIKHGYKFLRLAANSRKNNSKEDKINLKYSTINNSIKFSIDIVMLAAMLCIFLVPVPFNLIFPAALLIIWSAAKLINANVIRPKLNKRKEAELQKLKSVENEKTNKTELKQVVRNTDKVDEKVEGMSDEKITKKLGGTKKESVHKKDRPNKGDQQADVRPKRKRKETKRDNPIRKSPTNLYEVEEWMHNQRRDRTPSRTIIEV